jgi:hypothetical protein
MAFMPWKKSEPMEQRIEFGFVGPMPRANRHAPHAKAAELLEELDLGVLIAEIDTLLETARVETSAFADLLNDKVDLVPYGLMIQRTIST